MSGIPTNTTSVSLPTDLAQVVMQKAYDQSAVMQLATQIELPGRGLSIPTITGDPEAEWVDETDSKPVKAPGVGMKVMKDHTLAVILPFSNQFRRSLPALFDAIVARLPGAMAKKFDQTCIGAVNAPGTDFDTFASSTAQSLIATQNHTLYEGLVAADADISAAGFVMNGFALSPQARSLLLGATDNQGRPLFLNSVADGAVPLILSAPTRMGRGMYKAGVAPVGTGAGTPAVVGVAGDWTQAMYGLAKDIDITFSDQATLTYTDENSQTVTINLWQRNMFAVRCEFEAGFVCTAAAFNQLLGAVPSGS